MASRKFLIPVAAAVVGLISPSAGNGSESSADTRPTLGQTAGTVNSDEGNRDATLQTISYRQGNEAHALLLQRSPSGTVYPQHQSHSSHGSHGSHGSHRSGY
jgi:hypothetical protein